jgi:transposase
VVRSRTLKSHNRAAQALRMAAEAAGRENSGIGAYYRQMRGRIGAPQAITATAHKLARIVYHMLKERQSYRVLTAEAYDERHHQRELRNLQRRAAKLGLTLQPQPSG